MKIKTKIFDSRITSDMLKPATPGSAAIDLRACMTYPIKLRPGESTLIPSGIGVHIEDENYAGYVIPRSGLGFKKGLVLANLFGLIDSDYIGQIQITAWNRNQNLSDLIEIEPMQRIAQLIIAPIAKPEFVIVTELEQTNRCVGGFGSTGKH